MSLDFIRGLVRPLTLLFFIVANLGLLISGVFITEAREYIFQAVAIIEPPTFLILAWWFKERADSKQLPLSPVVINETIGPSGIDSETPLNN